MRLGIAVGTVVGTQKADDIEAAKYLLIDMCDSSGKPKGEFHVALDQVGAGHGDMVLMASGSPNRQTPRTFDHPIDASILGIVDLVEHHGETVYKK